MLSLLLLATVVLTGITYFRKTYRVRRRLINRLKKLDEFEKLKEVKNVKFIIRKDRVEVIKVPY